ncbi:hypothetical protein [Mycobacterium sp. DBP42]|uniref:hypothetical protein n=1 Tax=Mycobacterium sp. DBP42 TaxID=2545267 RepID=UPI00110CEF1F|nr:hypothetical protein [Mycobacterium sp. DBP42]
MTLPPQGPYGSQPAGGGGPQWGGPPPQRPGAQPPGGQWPQQPWGAPPRPNKGGKGKWILVGLALVAVIAVSIVGTVLVLRPDSGGGNGPQSNTANSGSEFASANDTGPANIITEDPTCDAWGGISRDISARVPEWDAQDYSVPAAQWTPEQRAVFDKKSAALTGAIKKVGDLAKRTPHRIMRELYNQYIAYSQAVIDSIPSYTSSDDNNIGASNKIFSTLNVVCSAIEYRVAQKSAPLISDPSPPSDVQALNQGSLEPKQFLDGGGPVCDEWISMVERFDKDTEAWRALDAKIPATEWTPEHKAVVDAVKPVMIANADDMEKLGRRSGNPAWEDLAVFAAQYRRAFVENIPSYTVTDNFLSAAAAYLFVAIKWACQAAES